MKVAKGKNETESGLNERNKALELALAQIEKQFGKGSIMKLGSNVVLNVESISTGAFSLDLALGVGGLPRGRVAEVFGPESSGKTTLILSAIHQTQAKGGVAAFIDAEHAFDAAYAKRLGINLDDLLISQPDTGEQALEIAETLVRSNAVDLVAIDSVAALTPRAEIEGDMGDTHIGLQARLMSQALRKLTAAISKSKTCVVFINQIRMKIGIMFGNPETTPGGRALKFYASVRIDLRRIGAIKSGDEIVGSKVRARVVKNKVAAPFKAAEFDILFNEGIDWLGNLLDTASNYAVVEKSGVWFVYTGQKLGQGKERAKQYLKDNPKLIKEIESRLKEAIRKQVQIK